VVSVLDMPSSYASFGALLVAACIVCTRQLDSISARSPHDVFDNAEALRWVAA